MSKNLETTTELTLNFKKLKTVSQINTDVIPVVVQEEKTGEVLIVAYTNNEAFEYTMRHNIVAFWSTSRNKLWIKGASSGNQLELIEARVNCEQNSLLYKVRLNGTGACHVNDTRGNPFKGCYYRKIDSGKLSYTE